MWLENTYYFEDVSVCADVMDMMGPENRVLLTKFSMGIHESEHIRYETKRLVCAHVRKVKSENSETWNL